MSNIFRTAATLACTVVVSATCLFAALAPAHTTGTTTATTISAPTAIVA